MDQGERVCDGSGCSSIDVFVPTRAPLAQGAAGRVAVVLRDGSVAIEGEATVIDVRTEAGRLGMTLRFAELDEASRALLAHFDRRRVAARSAPVPLTVQLRPGPASR